LGLADWSFVVALQTEKGGLGFKHALFPELVRLAWPITVSMLSFSTMTVVDTAFVGRLGSAALGGVGLGGMAAFTALCFGIGLLRSVKVLTSQAVGAGDRSSLGPVLGAGLALALGLGGLLVLLAFPLSRLVSHVAASGETGVLAAQYMLLRVLAAPLVFAQQAIREGRYGVGDSRSPMYAALVANLGHIPLNYALIFGCGWGVTGAALATVLSQVVELGILVYVQKKDGFGVRATNWAHVKDLFRVGLPLGVEFLLAVGAFSMLVVFVARMSNADLAAHQVAIQVVHFAFLPALAVGEAASVLAGQAVGANEDKLVVAIAKRGIGLAGAYAVACALVFITCAEPIMRLFTTDPNVRQIGARLLYVAAAFQIFDVIAIVSRAVLRGTGDVKVPMFFGIAVAWLCIPPLTYLFGFGLKLGVIGGWYGLAAEIATGAAWYWWRLSRSHWLPAAQRARTRLTQAALPMVQAAE
jgi:MATE family multidrug resistance protein